MKKKSAICLLICLLVAVGNLNSLTAFGYNLPIYALHISNASLKTWAQFGATTINITTPPDLPYVLDDDLKYEKAAENSYCFSGDLNALSEYYILFSSSEHNDRPINYPLIIGLIVGGVVLAGLSVGLFFFLKSKRQGRA